MCEILGHVPHQSRGRESVADIVIESAGGLRSPDGRVEIGATSTTYSDGRAVTQVIASYDRGGSGLIAFHEPRVSVAVEWVGNTRVVVSYPARLTPSNTHNTVVEGARVEYKPVPESKLPALKWVVESRIRGGQRRRQRRGSIVEITTDGRTRYRYDFYDTEGKGSHTKRLLARGYQAGGETWAGIIHGLLKLRAPELLVGIEMDPEADGLAIWSDSKATLTKVAKLVAAAKAHDGLLEAALQQATRDGQIE